MHGDEPQSSSRTSKEALQARALDRLRGNRVRPDRARNLHDDMQLQMKRVTKVTRAESALHQAWAAAAPDHLATTCTPIGLKAGRLEIAVPNASVKFQADRWLKGGGLAELSALAKTPIRGVRLQLGKPTRR